MATTLENLTTAINNYSAALAADSINPQPDYTLDGKTVNRAVWRDSLFKMIGELTKLSNQLNPFVITTRHWL